MESIGTATQGKFQVLAYDNLQMYLDVLSQLTGSLLHFRGKLFRGNLQDQNIDDQDSDADSDDDNSSTSLGGKLIFNTRKGIEDLVLMLVPFFLIY